MAGIRAPSGSVSNGTAATISLPVEVPAEQRVLRHTGPSLAPYLQFFLAVLLLTALPVSAETARQEDHGRDRSRAHHWVRRGAERKARKRSLMLFSISACDEADMNRSSEEAQSFSA